MALGSYPLGVGPLGFDPVADPSDPSDRQLLAPLIDPGTHDAVLLEGGSLLGVHPVDQAVSLAFGVRRGTLGSAPSQGHTLREIEYGGAGLSTRVRLAVEQALAVLINRGDVALVAVEVQAMGGGFAVEITYRNLRLPVDPSSPASPTTLRVPVT